MLPFATLSTLFPQQSFEPVQFTCLMAFVSLVANDHLIPLPWVKFFHSHLEGLVTNIRVPLGLFIAQTGESGAAPSGYQPDLKSVP